MEEYEKFMHEFKSSKKIRNSDNICMEKGTSCRSEKQLFFISYCKINKLYDLLGTSAPKEEGFIYSVDLDLSKSGISKFIFLIDDSLASASNDTDLKRDLPIFKLCIPTDISESSFFDFHCPFSDCSRNYLESRKCHAEPKIKEGIIKISKDLSNSSNHGLRRL